MSATAISHARTARHHFPFPCAPTRRAQKDYLFTMSVPVSVSMCTPTLTSRCFTVARSIAAFRSPKDLVAEFVSSGFEMNVVEKNGRRLSKDTPEQMAVRTATVA